MCGILAVLHAQAEGNAVAAELQYESHIKLKHWLTREK